MESHPLNECTKPEELEGLWVAVDRVVYLKDAETPPDRPHAFAYFLTIHNDSDQVVSIKGRKWVITNDEGRKTVVEGDGVVGEFPCLKPGEHFSYNSYHLNDTNYCFATGAYLGVTDGGRKVIARIPLFEMRVPGAGE